MPMMAGQAPENRPPAPGAGRDRRRPVAFRPPVERNQRLGVECSGTQCNAVPGQLPVPATSAVNHASRSVARDRDDGGIVPQCNPCEAVGLAPICNRT